MRYFRFLAFASVFALLLTVNETAHAAGSWGGSSGWSASSGGSSGGSGLLSRWRARHQAAQGSAGGSSGGVVMSSGSHGGSSGGSYGGSSGGSSGGQMVHEVSSHGSSGGSSGERVGPLKRLIAKMRARKAHRDSHGGSSGGSHGESSAGSHGGSSGGSHGGSSGGAVVHHAGGSSGGSSGGYASYSHSSAPAHSVSMGASNSYESSVIESSYNSYTPMGETVIESSSTGSVPMEGTTEGSSTINDSTRYESAKPAVEADAAMLTVAVPRDAKVTVNGHPTSSDGLVRQFKSRGLKDGYVYTYIVEATFNVNGEEKKESKSVKLRPGAMQRVEFVAPVEQPAKPKTQDVVTVVKLHVPPTANVVLAGNKTNGTGELRTFRTKQLKVGQRWAGYTIRVTANVNGRPVSKQRSIDVTAGSNNELTFDFNDKVAAR